MIGSGTKLAGRRPLACISISDAGFGFLVAGSGQLLGTFDAVFVRLSSASLAGMDGWKVIFWRFLVMAEVLLVSMLIARRGTWAESFKASPDWHGVAAAACITCCQLAYTWSLQTMPAANTIVVFASCPVLTALLSRALLGEPQPWRLYSTAVLAFLCIVFVSAGELEAAGELGFALAGLAAVSMALYSTICYKKALQDASPSMLPPLVVGGTLSALIASIKLRGDVAVSLEAFGWLVAQGLILPFWIAALTISTKYITPVEVNIVLLMDPILAPIWVWLAGFEAPPDHALLGSIVMAAILFFHGNGSDKEPKAGGLPAASLAEPLTAAAVEGA